MFEPRASAKKLSVIAVGRRFARKWNAVFSRRPRRYLVSANELRVKRPDKKAVQKARQMKDLYLAALADEHIGPTPYATRQALLSDAALTEDIAYATYGREILRRAAFASQGECVLVLWREFAWDKRGKLKNGFVLTADRIQHAEAAILAHLREQGSNPNVV